MEHGENASTLHTFIKDVCPTLQRLNFPRSAWVRLNRLRTGVGLLRLETHKWGVASTAACECGAKEQTAKHILPYLSPSKWSSCSLRCQQKHGDLADGIMYGHLVEQPAPVHLPSNKEE